MFRRLIPRFAACALWSTFAVPASGHQYELGPLVVGHPWSRPTAAGMPMGVAYLSITNNGKSADVLVAASSPAAARVEFHQTTLSDGMARMRPLTEVTIPAGATVKLEPGGIHIMLVDLKAPIELGRSVPLELQFRGAGKLTVQLSIESRDAPPAAENALSPALGVVTVVARTVSATDNEDALKHLLSLKVRGQPDPDFPDPARHLYISQTGDVLGHGATRGVPTTPKSPPSCRIARRHLTTLAKRP